jgi:DNA-cytosine methyltransferase
LKSINVLSLFDGISCGQMALERSRIPVKNYFASETDKYAIQVTQNNYPDTIQLGDVTKWKKWNLPKIDLLIGGSPCQGFSISGQGLNFDDPRSMLFFDYVEILRKLKKRNPSIKFMLENVKMKKEWKDIISEYLNVEPILINSSLVSAQNRERLYWTNFGNIEQPENKSIVLRDILEDNVDHEFFVLLEKEDIIEGCTKGKMEYVGGVETVNHKRRLDNGKTLSRNFSQGYRIYGDGGKSQTLVSTGVGGIGGFTGVYQIKGSALRNQVTKRGVESKLNIRKDEKSNCVVSSFSDKLNGISVIGNATDVKGFDIIKRIYDRNGKSPTLTTMQGGHRQPKVPLNNIYYRKLTPLECERLQTLPDNYTEGLSNSQRYKSIGNGWTVDVISHIFSYMKI